MNGATQSANPRTRGCWLDNAGFAATRFSGADLSIRTLGLAAVILATGFPALPGAQAETLNSALSRTYENNPAIRAAVASVKVSAEALPQARAGYLPSVQIQAQGQGYGSHQAITYHQAGTRLEQVYDTTGSLGLLSVNVAQTLYNGGKTGATMDIAESQAAAALAQLDGTVAQVFQSLVVQYINILRMSALIALNDDMDKQLKVLEAQAQSLFSKRLGTLTDVAQAQAATANNGAQRTNFSSSLAQARANYAALSGRAPDAPGSWPTLPALPATLDEAKRLAQVLNPSLRAARFGVAGARAGITVANSGFLPMAQLNGQYYAETNPTYNSNNGQPYNAITNTSGAMVWATLTIPIFSGGAVRSQVRQAQAQFNSNTYTMYDTFNQIVSVLESGWAQLQLAQERERLMAIDVKAAQQTLDGFTRQFHNGLSSMKDVLDSRQNLDTALQQQIGVRADILTIQANLLWTIGRFTPHDFGLVVKSYDAEAYVEAVRNSILGFNLP